MVSGALYSIAFAQIRKTSLCFQKEQNLQNSLEEEGGSKEEQKRKEVVYTTSLTFNAYNDNTKVD